MRSSFAHGSGPAGRFGVARRFAPVVGVLALAGAFALSAQEPTAPTECAGEWREWQRGRPAVCEVREITLPAIGSLDVDGGRTGGIRVTGERRDDVLVRAQVVAWARDEEAAVDVSRGIEILTDGTIRARGPRIGRRESWTVSYEIATPSDTDLNLEASNGRIAIDGVRGDIDFATVNGGVRLTDIGGNVRGGTTNGGVTVRLTGSAWQGEGLDVETTNGGVRIEVPVGYSARVDAAAVNGGVRVGPARSAGRRGRRVETLLGDGGALLRARTVNGGIRVDSY